MTAIAITSDNSIPADATLFFDTNPACPPDERYKMIATNEKKGQYAMYLFVSPDGYHFRQKTGRFNLSSDSGYDSANQAFFDMKRAYTGSSTVDSARPVRPGNGRS